MGEVLKPCTHSKASSPDAAASRRRALRSRGIEFGGGDEESGEEKENDAACSRQWGESLLAAAPAAAAAGARFC